MTLEWTDSRSGETGECQLRNCLFVAKMCGPGGRAAVLIAPVHMASVVRARRYLPGGWLVFLGAVTIGGCIEMNGRLQGLPPFGLELMAARMVVAILAVWLIVIIKPFKPYHAIVLDGNRGVFWIPADAPGSKEFAARVQQAIEAKVRRTGPLVYVAPCGMSFYLSRLIMSATGIWFFLTAFDCLGFFMGQLSEAGALNVLYHVQVLAACALLIPVLLYASRFGLTHDSLDTIAIGKSKLARQRLKEMRAWHPQKARILYLLHFQALYELNLSTAAEYLEELAQAAPSKAWWRRGYTTTSLRSYAAELAAPVGMPEGVQVAVQAGS